MATLAYHLNLYSYFKKAHVISDFTKKIFSINSFHSNTTYYKTLLDQYVDFASYIDIFKGTIQLRSIQTDVNIQPAMLGADAGAVMSTHGKPDFIFKEKNLSIYVYKWKLNGLKTRCEVHLYKSKAFFVNYAYNKPDRSEQEYILNSITRTYLGQYTNKVDLINTKLCDRNNNVLFINDSRMAMKVSYLSNCESDWYEAMAYVNNRNSYERFFNKM
jgi:hypothetical protein